MSNQILEVLAKLKESSNLNESQKAINEMNAFFSEEENSSYISYAHQSIPQILKLSGNKSNSELRQSAKICIELISKKFTPHSSHIIKIV